LRGIINFALDNELWVGTNPVRIPKQKRFKEVERKRCLGPDELTRLLAVADEYVARGADHRDLAHFVLLSLATGQRKRNVMEMKWADLDLNEQTWRLAATETKNKKELYVELGPAAMKVLKEREELKGLSPTFVFPGERRDRSIDPTRARFGFNGDAWRKLLKRAGLDYPRSDPRNFRGHDLRHTFVSYIVMAGRSLEQAGAAVGHASVASTKRYAHLAQHVQRESVLVGEREMQKRMAAASKQLPA
jgi:integrase